MAEFENFLRFNERTAVFIDGANLYATIQTLNYNIDYRKLRDNFHHHCNLLRIFYYTAMNPNKTEHQPMRQVFDWLDFNGFTMVTKPLKEFDRGDGVKFRKGNMDVDIAIDMLRISPHVDHIVLFSGDGDFARLVAEIQRDAVRVTVISSMDQMAQELRRQADTYVDLKDLRNALARERTERIELDDNEE